MKADYYDIMGISEDADAERIKSSYRKMALKYHPDRNPDDEGAAQKFREISEAYEVLGNSKRRREYDIKRKKFHSSSAGKENSGVKRGSLYEKGQKRNISSRRFSANPDNLRDIFENTFRMKKKQGRK